jgi:hypothetical protein
MENPQQPTATVVSTKEWVLAYLIMIIPLVNIIMLFVWAFGTSENPNKANWAKARLIWLAIGLGFALILWFTVIGALLAGFGDGAFS